VGVGCAAFSSDSFPHWCRLIFKLPETQRLSVFAEGDNLHALKPVVKMTNGQDLVYGGYAVVDPAEPLLHSPGSLAPSTGWSTRWVVRNTVETGEWVGFRPFRLSPICVHSVYCRFKTKR